jgi:hypothetical protein
MKVKIQESGVVFGDFDTRDVFTIEQALIAHRISEKGVKTVEFILLQTHSGNQVVSFVEAKSSVPRQTASFFADIQLKIQHSLITWFCAVTGRNAQLSKALPTHLSHVKALSLPLRFILVIPELPDAIIPQMNDAFRKVLKLDCQLWGVEHSAVFVLNQSRATKLGLIHP